MTEIFSVATINQIISNWSLKVDDVVPYVVFLLSLFFRRADFLSHRISYEAQQRMFGKAWRTYENDTRRSC